MNKIIKLNESIIKQIAAGEVIQKQYNAVKEIIENAIDAYSNEIYLYFENYGFKSIIIIDNGSGLSKEDLLLSTQLHTTSKTKKTDQMFGNNFLGFRGEALASIDAISDLTIESNNHKLKDGKISPSNITKGTKIIIENIFQKTPARLKFIKNPKLEFKIIKETIKKYALNYENIKINAYHNNKIILKFEPNNKKNRIDEIFNEESIFIQKNSKNLSIDAYILKKNIKTNYIFVNNRPIKDKIIFKFITSLFKEYTFINENPGYILFITINNLFVDFNVHPAKEEVKFFNYTEIFQVLSSIFSMNNLSYQLNNNIIYESHVNENHKIEEEKLFTQQLTQEKINLINDNIIKHVQEESYIDHSIKENDLKEEYNFKIIGQLKNTYIFFETENGFAIFDQHASHERIIYEQIKSNMKKNNSQPLLIPINLNLTIEQEEFILNHKTNLKEKGIIIINNRIESIPNFLKTINFKDFFENLQIPCDLDTEINRLFANIACKQALKANTWLSLNQMQVLLQEALKNPPICNHGRPIFKYFSNNEIMNFFKRT